VHHFRNVGTSAVRMFRSKVVNQRFLGTSLNVQATAAEGEGAGDVGIEGVERSEGTVGGEVDSRQSGKSGSFEEKGPHLGPVPQIEQSESLAMSGTPDALLELRESELCVCMREREKERECVCVCVCERDTVCTRVCVCVCVYICI